MAGVKEEADSSLSSSTATLSASSLSHHSTLFPQIHFDYDQEYLFQDHLVGSDERMITKFGTIMLIIICICIYMYASSLHILLFKCTYIYACDQVCIFSSTYLHIRRRVVTICVVTLPTAGLLSFRVFANCVSFGHRGWQQGQARYIHTYMHAYSWSYAYIDAYMYMRIYIYIYIYIIYIHICIMVT